MYENSAKRITNTQFKLYANPAPLGVMTSARYSHIIGPIEISKNTMNHQEKMILETLFSSKNPSRLREMAIPIIP